MKTGISLMAVVLTAVVVWSLAAADNKAAPSAVGKGATRVGVLDLVKVFNEFEQTKVLNAEIDKYKAKLGEEKVQREDKIDTEKKTLQTFAPDSADYQRRVREVRKMMIEYRAWLESEQQSLTEEHRRWIERTYDMVTQTTATVARAHGIDVIITKEDLDKSVSDTTVLLKQILNRKVVYASPDLDITDEVMKSLNDLFAKSGGAKSIQFGM
ncbi:MAG TPA: OmpH family outer membrane protein [Phycisphaerae bacterium]|nr:OmpH family outer membrane protein [Phycisphaerae bacterium]HRY66571.1 OmpH family outer membrane protein [Phycisphaerae bacterium]HSA26991.1 OmpH family outer membrane protein [Phycisphaerae bacterium]